ncbi:diphosphomevalonate decarboxylase [Pediococcus acidilactici]|uniref:diphosphomevalonate decarboxylase n=1 Tax=Pediococcus acidilactici TaxID=1254 RepID=UPI00232D35E8|nr:diphosphomevalonate decarboxylase [Pediococcus acidilactici]MDB8867944.1 diphosphomevalonate decarboxylase [Pediococcus acidilactici]
MKKTDKKRGFARAHTNIALIKYWGKVDSELIIPANDSVSLTLDEFYTDTVVNFSEDYKVNEFWLNGNLMPYKHMARINRVIDAVKEEYDYPGFAKIRSFNHVPTSAGLASSASGMAALAGAAADALGDEHDLTNISRIARLGSGSASRSVFGGIVHWHRGSDHESSFVEQVVSEKDIDLNMVTVVVNSHQKSIKSTNGMQRTVETSPFYPTWVSESNRMVPEMLAAVKKNDFTKIGELAEHSAMMMHATTLAAIPAFTYFQPDTLKVIRLVTQLRKEHGIECYYTIDAGPNVKVLCQNKDILAIRNFLKNYFEERQLVIARPGSGIKFSKN